MLEKLLITTLACSAISVGQQARSLSDVLGNELTYSHPQTKTLLLERQSLDEITEAEGALLAKNFSGLEGLYLAGNNLRGLPNSIGFGNGVFSSMRKRLSKLEEIDLSNNKLQEVPECLGALSSLRWLNLSRNQLSFIPEWLCRLTRLEGLSLQDNHLANIPATFYRLQSTTFSLLGNKFSEQQQHIIDSELKAAGMFEQKTVYCDDGYCSDD